MSTKQQHQISFSLQGEFATEHGRNKLFHQHNLKGAIEFLTGCMQCDQLDPKEIEQMAYDILNGRAEITGTYPGPDYTFQYIKDCENKSDISDAISKWTEQLDELKDYKNKLTFIHSYMSDNMNYQLSHMEDYYENEFGEPLFDEPKTTTYNNKNPLLDSFMERMHTDTDDDYGWLEPDGTFHPVEWGEHEKWAANHVQTKMSNNDWFKASSELNIAKSIHAYGDYLINNNWCLLHNPAQGIAIVTKCPNKKITKAQAEFLYDYYIKRKQSKTANEIWNEYAENC